MFLYNNLWKLCTIFNFGTDFLENEKLFQKTVVSFLVESIKIENAWFPYKTVISEVNVKTIIMVSTKLTYCNERSFDSNYFIFFFLILFQFRNL